jgi:hypothetical protein
MKGRNPMKRNHENNDEMKQPTYILKYLKLLIFAAIVTIGIIGKSSIAWATTMVNVTIDYTQETATVMTGTGGSTKFFVSFDNKTWELLDPIITLNNAIVIDISTSLKSKETTVYFRGNKDTTPNPIVLNGEDASLKAAYTVTNGSGAIALSNATYPVEYRIGTNGQWRDYGAISTALYENKGASLYFRTKADKSRRAGKIVTVKIPKKPSAPSVKVDGSKMNISGLKSGETLFRKGDDLPWIPFQPSDPKVKTLDINGLFAAVATDNKPITGGVLEVRYKASDKKVASSVRVIEIPTQPTVPDTIYLNGTTLTIQDNNTKRAYEYTRVEKTQTLNLQTAKWSTLTAARPVIIPKASIDDKIYVRLKSTTDTKTKIVTPASTYKELIVKSITIKGK